MTEPAEPAPPAGTNLAAITTRNAPAHAPAHAYGRNEHPRPTGFLAVRHLLDLGHRDVGVITGPTFTSTARDRLAGARRAMDEADLPLRARRVLSVGYSVDDGVTAGRRLLERTNRPTAIFAANDNLAIGVQTAARLLDLVPGRDVSIVGYNDIPLVAQLPVPLTSVRTPFDTIAATALDLAAAPPGLTSEVRRTLPTLIPRASTLRAG